METQAAQNITDMLLTTSNMSIMIASWFLVVIAKSAAPKLFARPSMIRMLPVLPTFIAVGLVWIPGLRPEGATVGATFVFGVVLGWGASQVYKILAQTVLGRDDRIAHLKDPVEPPGGPAAEPAPAGDKGSPSP